MTGLIARYYEQWGTLAGQWGALAAGVILIVSTVNAATGSALSFLGPIPLIMFLLIMVLAVACQFSIDDEEQPPICYKVEDKKLKPIPNFLSILKQLEGKDIN